MIDRIVGNALLDGGRAVAAGPVGGMVFHWMGLGLLQRKTRGDHYRWLAHKFNVIDNNIDDDGYKNDKKAQDKGGDAVTAGVRVSFPGQSAV
jgi:hypothetical protein